jgi:hypothetical protein
MKDRPGSQAASWTIMAAARSLWVGPPLRNRRQFTGRPSRSPPQGARTRRVTTTTLSPVAQRHQLAGGGQPVLDDVGLGEHGELLDADAVMAKPFHGRPRPERPVFFQDQVPPSATEGVLGPDVGDLVASGG